MVIKDRPKALAIATEVPLRAGSGAAVRSYFFLQALAREFDLTLVITGADDLRETPARLREACHAIVGSKDVETQLSKKPPASRLGSWLRTFRTTLQISRQDSGNLYRLAEAFEVPLRPDIQITPSNPRHDLVRKAIRSELDILETWGAPLPYISFRHWAAFSRMRHYLEANAPEHGYDLIWLEHSFLQPLVDNFTKRARDCLQVCNTHNIEHRLHMRNAEHASTPELAEWLHNQSRIVRSAEKACFLSSDIVLACSDEDRKLAMELAPNVDIIVAPNGVDTSYFQPNSTQTVEKPTLLFTGNMSYEPNADAVSYFLDQIFPFIIEKDTRVELVVAGRDADIFASRCAMPQPGVRFVANPADMRPLFDRAWVCVVPLRSGGGTRLKIFEAMAMRKAVVSTWIGAEGVPYHAGEDILICDDPHDFSESVLKLIDDADLRKSVADSGYQFACQNYDWSQITANAFKKILDALRNKKSGQTSIA